MKIQPWLFKILRKQSVTDGRTHGQTDVKTIYPTTNKVCGGYNKSRWILMCFFRAMQNMLFSACVRWIFLTTYINTTTTTSWATKASHSIWKATLTNKEQQNIIGRGVERDTMPDLSPIAQFHSGQVRCTCPGDKFKEIEYMCWYKLNTHVFISYSGLKLRVRTKKLIFLFLIQNICCGYSKELSHWNGSFEHPKHMIKLMGKKIFTSLRLNFFAYQNLWYWYHYELTCGKQVLILFSWLRFGYTLSLTTLYLVSYHF